MWIIKLKNKDLYYNKDLFEIVNIEEASVYITEKSAKYALGNLKRYLDNKKGIYGPLKEYGSTDYISDICEFEIRQVKIELI